MPYFRTTLGVSSLMYQGFKIWNEIPRNLKILNQPSYSAGNTKNTFSSQYECNSLCMYVYVRVCAYVYMYIDIRMVCVYVHVYMYIYIYIYM